MGNGAGAACVDAAAQAATLEGVAKVLCAEDPVYDKRMAEPVADLIVSLAGDFSHIVAHATTDAKNILPRVAALLDVMILSGVTTIIESACFERPVYAGNALQTVQSDDTTKVITFRTANFDATGIGGPVKIEPTNDIGNPGLSRWLEDKVAASDRPELKSAGVVVSGGRGVGS